MEVFSFSRRSEENLQGVHSDLVEVMRATLARSHIDFAITEGVRSFEKQLKMFESGKSMTTKSRHLTGHAVDILVYINGKHTWEYKYYDEIAKLVNKVGDEKSIATQWGGDWVSFKDGVHFELARSNYP